MFSLRETQPVCRSYGAQAVVSALLYSVSSGQMYCPIIDWRFLRLHHAPFSGYHEPDSLTIPHHGKGTFIV